MKTIVSLAVLAFAVAAAPAWAQGQHQQHHPSGAAPAPTAPPAPGSTPAQRMPMGPMMQAMPEQCRAAMQAMPAECRGAMGSMMQGGGMPHGGAGSGAASGAASGSEATKAYVEAMDRMHGPMMEGVQAPNPDVAFVRGMIPHHQGAIDMALIVLKYGRDEQVKKWAGDVIREQQREIAEMEAWLRKNGQ